MAVLGIDTGGGLSRTTNIKPVRLGNMDVLIGVFRHTRADDGEILFGFRTGRTTINEGIIARAQIYITHQTRFPIL
jgi:hypothetical protein